MTKRHYFYCIKVVFDISNKDNNLYNIIKYQIYK